MSPTAPAPGPGVTGAFADLSARLDEARRLGSRVGVVLTMGALHEGHASLIRTAAAECDVVAVSVFVNPTQFADPGDLSGYPRTLEADVALAAAAGADVVVVTIPMKAVPALPPDLLAGAADDVAKES